MPHDGNGKTWSVWVVIAAFITLVGVWVSTAGGVRENRVNITRNGECVKEVKNTLEQLRSDMRSVSDDVAFIRGKMEQKEEEK